jgi:hypothetical protein
LAVLQAIRHTQTTAEPPISAAYRQRKEEICFIAVISRQPIVPE